MGCDRATGDNFALNGLASGDGGDDTIIGAEGSVGDNNGITTAGGGGDDSITGTSRGDAPMIGDNTGDGGGGTDQISACKAQMTLTAVPAPITAMAVRARTTPSIASHWWRFDESVHHA